jgi:hypothetical protein
MILTLAISAVLAASAFARETFGDGTYRVPQDVKPGTYRSLGGDGCYWARLKNFSGSLDSILANENAVGPAVVTIKPTDRGFETNGCANWTRGLRRITKSKTRFGEGTYVVKTDILPGTYRTRGGDGCYWARLSDFEGDLNSIVANDNVSGPAIVAISRTDRGFTSNDCGTWSRLAGG